MVLYGYSIYTNMVVPSVYKHIAAFYWSMMCVWNVFMLCNHVDDKLYREHH